ncbi:MAG: vitamin K epoxide reductase [Anaerolineae bacterium]|nr:vitamin K epoxide reductase [Anaerolineae bacterium]
MKRFTLGTLLSLCLLSGLIVAPVTAEGEISVRAVMFYSPSCGHCHYVIENVLTPLIQQHKGQFEVVGVNIAEEGGQQLYQSVIDTFAIPPERQGVPTLIIGENVLVGSVEIPEQLPGLVESYLGQGGVDWPAIPGFADALAANAPTPTAQPDTATAEATIETPAPTTVAPENTPLPTPTADPAITGIIIEKENWRDRFARDPLGNGLSVLVLVGMLVSILFQGWRLLQPSNNPGTNHWHQAVLPLVVLGLIVAGYLAYVETQQVVAVCGPVGDCNAVQQSDYALLFGFLPIAVLGVLGYIAIGVAWAVARWARPPWADLAQLALAGMTWFGVAFSIYLTFLEPFVIGATCAWCLTSAVIMTVLLWLVAPLLRPAAIAVGSLATHSLNTHQQGETL